MTVTGVVAVTPEVVAVNVPVLLPVGIIKLAGTVRFAELLARVIDAPPEPAFADSVTGHVLEAPPPIVDGVQLTEEIVATEEFMTTEDEDSYAPIESGLGRVFHWMSVDGAPVAVPASIAGDPEERRKSNRFCAVS